MSGPRPRVVLLGASNLRFALPLVVDLARRRFGGPLEVLAAPGEARSYGEWSRFLWRELPGIVACGLWPALASETDDRRPTWALLADVGNDVAFGVPPARIAGWVETCLDRLSAAGARSALTLFPAASVARLGPLRFHVLRRVLFPGRRVSRAYVGEAAAELNRRLREAAARRAVPIVEPPAAWYGLDAIHIRRRMRPAAWAAMLDALGGDVATARETIAATVGPPGATPRRAAPYAHCRAWGRERRCPQPALRLRDGTTVAIY